MTVEGKQLCNYLGRSHDALMGRFLWIKQQKLKEQKVLLFVTILVLTGYVPLKAFHISDKKIWDIITGEGSAFVESEDDFSSVESQTDCYLFK